jgi:drug/metabolite transporter (DMT)-like permease
MSNSEALDLPIVIDRPAPKTDRAATDRAATDRAATDRAAARTGQAQAPQVVLRGIVLIVASTVFFSGADVITKSLSGTLPAIEIAWLRYAVFAGILLPPALKQWAAGGLRSLRPELQVLRAFGMVGSALLFTAGLGFLPVAEATAMSFVSPIFITALSIVFLGEVVGWRRWSAAAVGLIGVLVVVRPGTGAFQAAALFPLMAALSWAGAVIVTRKMSGADHPTTTLTYSALLGFAVLTVLLPFNWVVPGWREIGLGIALGILSTIGHGLIVLAYRHASASVIAPFSYFQLIGSGALAYLVFGSVPDRWTFVGAGIIAASGLYTAHRERVRAHDRRTAS